jgi:hypothetical protein
MRHKAIGALIAVALAVGVVAAPAMAAEGPLELKPPGGELVTHPVSPSEIGAATSGASPSVALTGSCSIGEVCAWVGIFAGEESIWPESNTGCHNHVEHPRLGSGYNGSSYRERVGGWGYVASHYAWESVGGVVTGELCWPA